MVISLSEYQITRRIERLVKEYNASQPQRRLWISTGVEKTFVAILHKYMQSYRPIAKYRPEELAHGWPSTRTNRPELYNLTGLSEKTVYNHITKLQKLGLIEKKFHGWQSDFELWIHGWILTGEGEKPQILPPIEKIENPPETLISAPIVQTLPPINIYSINNNINSIVEKSAVGPDNEKGSLAGHAAQPRNEQEPSKNSAGTFSGTQEASPSATKSQDISVNNCFQEQISGGAGREICGTGAGARLKKKLDTRSKQTDPDNAQLATGSGSAALLTLYMQLVTQLWEYSKLTFYKHYLFTEKEEAAIKNLIWRDVFGGFKADWPIEQWQAYFKQTIERVDLAKSYIAACPDRYVPHPKKYFDRNFKHGFIRTYHWYLKHKILKNQIRHQAELEKARKSMASGKVPQGLKQRAMSRLQLFQYWQNRLSKLKDQDVLAAFYNSCKDPALLNFNKSTFKTSHK